MFWETEKCPSRRDTSRALSGHAATLETIMLFYSEDFALELCRERVTVTD
jgi:hypothetical protein